MSNGVKIEIPKAYNPKEVEDKIYRLWEKSGFFNPDRLPKRHKKPYCIVMPPPNVTGSLHMGHALNATVQDVLIRWKRLKGFKTLWLPGVDHAGIATQNVVEKELKKEGKTRFDLGREKFIERVWQWKEKYGNIILDQFKKIGASCDWSRTRFTMDEDYQQAVREAFLHYYKKGWIYRGKRVINWCPRCQTSLSDLEVEYQEEKSKLWYIKYQLAKTGGKDPKIYIIVATTRPETMLGDTAVAVNPKDLRYKDFVGKKVILPLSGREIPIISDKSIDQNFGTGAVKITPAHDLNDYEIGKKHGLEMIQVIDETGRITKKAPFSYQGLTVSEARQKIVEDLRNQSLLEKEEDYNVSRPGCYRCKTTLEIILSDQWFLRMDHLAKTAIEAVRKGKVKFVPKKWEKIYFNWLKNIKDWCISRQIWWGHRLPVWQNQTGTILNSQFPISNKISNDRFKKMGVAANVVPQIFKGKTKTYRIRDHKLKVGDKVYFENSQTGKIFGYGIINESKKTKVKDLPLRDKAHSTLYKNLDELIAAFKYHNPGKEVGPETEAYIYGYNFVPREDFKNPDIKNSLEIENSKIEDLQKIHIGDNPPEGYKQVEDVLDTWFSSALWPFATLGWPEKKSKKQNSKFKNDLKEFYPTDVLTTDRDIINLWVARMVFSGLEFMKKAPFEKVYIHATVLTREGKRMSKSLGTGIDPLGLIQKYGADSTRFGIVWQIMKGQDIRFVEETMVMGRKFCNKIWNASRFVSSQIGNKKITVEEKRLKSLKNLTPADRKIIKLLEETINSVDKDLDDFHFGQASRRVYKFFWEDFCSKYIEQSKSQLLSAGTKKEREKTKIILLSVLFASLRILHPFVPFLTEEIYQNLPIINKKKSLIIENWPIF
jgi:valyl-tRNA synthetase